MSNRIQSDQQVERLARREEILTHAARLFAQYGYSETDTTLLAETVGVGKGTVYRYFPSKRELFLAAADRVMRMLRAEVEESIAKIDDPLHQIRAGVQSFFAFFAEHPECVELLMQERAQFKDRTESTIIEHRRLNVERWREMYTNLIAAGRIREMPVDRITDMVGNLMYGTIFTNYFSGAAKSPAAQADDVIDIIFRGILTPQELQRQLQSTRLASNA